MPNYDLMIIGSGPAGEKAAIKAAYYGKKVALVEKQSVYGGAGINTGTIPSKTLKETALYLCGWGDSGLFGIERKLERTATIQDFYFHKNKVVEALSNDVKTALLNYGVDIYSGTASFVDANTLEIKNKNNTKITGYFTLIATGSYPFHPTGIPFDGVCIYDSDTILNLKSIPKSIVIVGAGVIGCEYATIFAAMGAQVTLINSRGAVLPWLDREVADTLLKHMNQEGIRFITDVRLEQVTVHADVLNKVQAHLSNGESIQAEVFLYAAGRCGNVKDLNLAAVNIAVNDREIISVDSTYCTSMPNIYAAGDVIGFPSLASTSMDQGRVAVAHMFGLHDIEYIATDFPYGVYTIPEVSTFGVNEEVAQQKKIDYVVGHANYADTPRGRILGAKLGFLKLVVDRSTHQVLGVHIIGPIATELIHYGMDVVENKRTIGYIVSTVFNCPTLHELYKYAAYNVFSVLGVDNICAYVQQTAAK